jgi:hypothetical protein
MRTSKNKPKAKLASLKLLRNSKPSPASSTAIEIKNLQSALSLLIRREREKAAEAKDLSLRCSNHEAHASRALTAFTRLVKKGVFAIALIACAIAAQADDRRERHERHESHNYIIERQQAYQVQGVPTDRLIIGKREIDIYPNGLMFEGNHVVGVKGH